MPVLDHSAYGLLLLGLHFIITTFSLYSSTFAVDGRSSWDSISYYNRTLNNIYFQEPRQHPPLLDFLPARGGLGLLAAWHLPGGPVATVSGGRPRQMLKYVDRLTR